MTRVTTSMMPDTFLWNLQRNSARLDHLQNQIASQQRILRPSDDPIGTATVLRLDSTKAQNAQYIKNIQNGQAWLSAGDQTLQSLGDTIQRAREITLQAANGTLSPDDRNAVATELRQLLDHAVQLGNTQVAGEYIFSGQLTRTAPFDAATLPPVYQGDTGPISRTVAPGVTVAVNVTGDDAVLPTLNALSQALSAVTANDPTAMRAGIDALDAGQSALLAAQAEIGARGNRLDALSSGLDARQISIAQQRSDTQDVDMAQALTDYATLDTVYKAALAAGARALQPSLFDYLG